MHSSLPTWLPRLRARHALFVVLLLAAVLGGRALVHQARTWLVWHDLLDQVEAVDAAPKSEDVRTRTWSFRFQDTTATVTAVIDMGELERARAVDTSGVFGTRLWLRAGYISALVREQAMSRFVSSLSSEFRRLRAEMALDDDEYLELMTHAIQAIPYGEPKNDVLLPIEVIADGNGVCSEKSILLASLMLHEGYDTAVWVLETQGHAAVGVRSNGAEFWDSGYAFIETTKPYLVGQLSSRYAAKGPVTEPPEMVRVGGSVPYTAGRQVEYITERLVEYRATRAIDRVYPRFARTGAKALRVRYATKARKFYMADGTYAWVMQNTHDRDRVYRTLIDRSRILAQ